MFRPLSEPDWRLFRELHPIALERFCQRVLSELHRIIADSGRTAHERYLAVFELIEQRDRAMAHAFNDSRRSTAILKLMHMQALELLTEEEVSRFRPETREVLWREG